MMPRSALVLVLAVAMLPACAGSAPPPAAPTPPAPSPVAATTPPPPPPPAPAPPPAAAVEAPPPEAPKHHLGHHRGMADMFLASLDSLELKPEQKTAVDAIESDLEKLADATKDPKQKLVADVSDGVAAGKIDHAKTDADIKALTTAVAATEPTIQEAMNRLHKTLDPAQRKKLVESVREKGKAMREHEAMEHEHEAMEHEHGAKEHEHGAKEHEGKGPAAHEGKGPKAGCCHEEHEGHEHEGDEHEGRLMKLGDELGLTPEQKEKLHTKLEAHMKAQHAAMKEKMAGGEKHMMAIGAAFEGEKFDAKKAGVGAMAPDMVKAMATARVQLAEAILSVLTPDQRPKFAAHIKDYAREEHDED